jgi:hypothetical protein
MERTFSLWANIDVVSETIVAENTCHTCSGWQASEAVPEVWPAAHDCLRSVQPALMSR